MRDRVSRHYASSPRGGMRSGVGIVATALLAACGSGGASAPTSNAAPPAALHMNLYPVSGNANSPPRLFIFVTAVGSNDVRLPLALDTGSAGLTLNALAIFPSSMVSSGGFDFNGATSISYNGITVTEVQGTRAYGGASGRTEIGNLGFATVSFGDSAGTLTTHTMPVFLYYSIRSNQDPYQSLPAETQEGWFGVNAAPNLIKAGATTANAPECTSAAAGSCWVASVFKYLAFPSGIDAGFVLSPLQVQACDITSEGSCMPTPALTVGLDAASASGFTLTNLPCPPASYTGPSQINGYPVCQEYVPNTDVIAGGSAGGSFTTTVLFDTGTPEFIFNVPSEAAFPATVAAGTPFQLATPGGFVYSATAGAGIFQVSVQPQIETSQGSVAGLGYFHTNSLLVNFSAGTQGWK